MVRCMFCGQENFNNLDEVYSHQMIITSEGKSICPKFREWNTVVDSAGANEVIPRKVAGKKYAPKNHDGIFIVYTNQGKLAQDPKKIGANQLIKHILHGKSPIGIENG